MSQQSPIPPELRSLKSWCVWKLEKNSEGRSTKIPYSVNGARAESDKPETWCTFDEARAAYDKGGYSGIGLLISPPYVGIDFDEVVELPSMKIHPVVQGWLDKFGSYAEFSPSCFNQTKAKGGVKVWVKGVLPEPLPESGPKNKLKQIEIYSCLRYFTVTGARVPNSPSIVSAVELAEFYGSRKAINASLAAIGETTKAQVTTPERMLRLGRGEWKELGYESQSVGDLAYVGHLAKVCNGDAIKIDANFRLSGLMRPKWNELRGEKTYGAITIENALKDFKKVRRLLLNVRTADAITPTITNWIWPGVIPLGKTWYGFGGPGVGKSICSTDILARASSGRPWPDGQKNIFPPCKILVVTFSEDTYDDIFVPSLMVHEADRSKFHCIDGLKDEEGNLAGSFSLGHLDVVRSYLGEHRDIKIVYINPLSAGFGSGKMNDQQDVRAKFDPLNQLADDLGVTMMPIGHDKKGLETSAINKSSGSQQIVGGPRAVFYFMAGKRGEPSSMVSAKISQSVKVGLKYEIVKVPHPLPHLDIHNIGMGKVQWLGKQEKTADELCEESVDPVETKSAKVKQFIKAALKTGPQPASVFWDWAQTLGGEREANRKMMQRAKKALGIVGSEIWSLPEEEKVEVPDFSDQKAVNEDTPF